MVLDTVDALPASDGDRVVPSGLPLVVGSARPFHFAALRFGPTFELPLSLPVAFALFEPYVPPVLGPCAGSSLLRCVLHAHAPATCRHVGSLRDDVLGQVNVNCASGGHQLQTGRGCVVVLRSGWWWG